MKTMYLMAVAFTCLTLALSAQAYPVMPTCKVMTKADALNCMNRVAALLPEHEEPNDALVGSKTLLAKVMTSLATYKEVRLARAASFGGAVIQHGDEHHVFYYAIPTGNAVKPVLLLEQNLVDLAGSFKNPIREDELLLGNDVDDYDVADDIRSAIDEALEAIEM